MADLSLKTALLSAYNRDGLVDFAKTLVECGYQIVSTGGTAAELRDAGISAMEVSELTGAEEILDGRVKTLHPSIHGGLLARRNDASHMDELRHLDIQTIDVVVNNLYPFVETIRYPDAALDDALENIDIGGPAMTRAAAKNHTDVLVIVDPNDYNAIGEALKSGGVGLVERRRLAAKAFQHVAAYDTAVATYLREYRDANASDDDDDNVLPHELSFGYRLVKRPRYGENPHQSAGAYSTPGDTGGIVNAKQLHGIEMSYLNYCDADAAWSIVRSFSGFSRHACAVIKHANPCGLAVRDDQAQAWETAREGDPISAFGGIVAFNQIVETQTAEAMRGILLDVVVAPGYSNGALEALQNRKRTRVLEIAPHIEQRLEMRMISGGALVQNPDHLRNQEHSDWQIVTERHPSNAEHLDLCFAWRACRYVRSNAIVFAKDRAMVGMGAGQPNRVISVSLAARAAAARAEGAVMASDAFFPFPDGIEAAARAGIKSIVQPGGSVKDADVIRAANDLGLSMVLTGRRHFYH